MKTTQKGIRYEYEIINDNEVRITGAELGEATELELSELEVDGKSYAVTEIGYLAFAGCDSLKEVSLPNVTTIGEQAFANCDNLTLAFIPKAIIIEDLAFVYNNCLKEVSFPEATYIGNYAFANCESLKEISFPKVTTISNSAFEYCDSLKGATFLRATEIGDSAFANCKSLEEASFPKAKIVGNNVFINCENLEKINIPNVASIKFSAFANCNKLIEATLPELNLSRLDRVYPYERDEAEERGELDLYYKSIELNEECFNYIKNNLLNDADIIVNKAIEKYGLERALLISTEFKHMQEYVYEISKSINLICGNQDKIIIDKSSDISISQQPISI